MNEHFLNMHMCAGKSINKDVTMFLNSEYNMHQFIRRYRHTAMLEYSIISCTKCCLLTKFSGTILRTHSNVAKLHPIIYLCC